MIVHPGYHDINNDIIDNIALVKLSNPIKFNEDVRPICLPDVNTRKNTTLKLHAPYLPKKERGKPTTTTMLK